MIAPLSLHQRVEWHEVGKPGEKPKVWTGTVAVIWNDGKEALVHTDTGAIMRIEASQVGVPTTTYEVDVNLDDAETLAVQILARKPPPGSVTEQMIMLAAAVLKLRLAGAPT